MEKKERERKKNFVDCGLWNVVPLFNGFVKLLDIPLNVILTA